MKILLLIVSLFPLAATAAPTDICDILNLPNCRGVTRQMRRNTFQTAPTTSTASNLNPANVSFDKGFGVELLAQAGNPLLFSATSGTGKMGGALISGAMDNTFFGNRVPEADENFLERSEEQLQYKNKKLTFALGAKLTSTKNAGFDIGLLLKRHSEIKKINPGAGMSGRIWLIHFGASVYRDDTFIDLKNTATGMSLGEESVQESFTVTTYTVGTRIKNFAFDVGTIQSKLKFYDDEPTRITLYSASYNVSDFLFNLAVRNEHSMAKTYDHDLEQLKEKENKSSMYLGIQYSFNKHIIFGLNYNYFLLNEASATMTLFI